MHQNYLVCLKKSDDIEEKTIIKVDDSGHSSKEICVNSVWKEIQKAMKIIHWEIFTILFGWILKNSFWDKQIQLVEARK